MSMDWWGLEVGRAVVPAGLALGAGKAGFLAGPAFALVVELDLEKLGSLDLWASGDRLE